MWTAPLLGDPSEHERVQVGVRFNLILDSVRFVCPCKSKDYPTIRKRNVHKKTSRTGG